MVVSHWIEDSLVFTTVKQKCIFCATVLLIKLDMVRAEELPGFKKNCWLLFLYSLLSPSLYSFSHPSIPPSLAVSSFFQVSLMISFIKQRGEQGLIKIRCHPPPPVFLPIVFTSSSTYYLHHQQKNIGVGIVYQRQNTNTQNKQVVKERNKAVVVGILVKIS